MKNRLLLILASFLTLSYPLAADNPLKLGYVNLDYVMSMLPDGERIETDLKAFETQLRNQLETQASEFQKKLQIFQKGHETMTDAVKNQKEVELRQLHDELEKLQIEAQNSLSKKQLELLKPVYEKTQKTIEEIAKENKYTHIVNSSTGGVLVLLYGEKEYDISDLVLKRLGVDPVSAQIKQAVQLPAQQVKTQQGKKLQDKQTKPQGKK